jgi:SAM-dependent methyltransferase
MWYNEEFLAPFFLNHYSWADKIHILLDADTNDRTEEIAREYPNVEIEHFKFPDMMDDIIKVAKLNDKYRSIKDADYVALVDSDEFIFCNNLKKAVRTHLEETRKDVYFVNLWQIFKHETDPPLDPNASIPLQRRHGDPNMDDHFNVLYIKPAIVKGGKNLCWTCGNHEVVYEGNSLKWQTRNLGIMESLNVSVRKNEMLQGSHWRLVDLEETIKRRINNRKNRQSQVNLAKGLTFQYHDICEQQIIDEYHSNKSLPIVISSTSDTDAGCGQPSPAENTAPPVYTDCTPKADTAPPAPADCTPEPASIPIRKKSLDLGCGPAPRNPFYADEVFGVDVRENLAANIVSADLTIEPIPYGDESFEYMSAHNFLEHIPRVIYAPARRNPFIELMNEVYRVLKMGGMFLSFTPAYPHAPAFQDPTHVNIITEETFRLYFDNVNRWAAMYGFRGAFVVRIQEWRGAHLLTVLQKVPAPCLPAT